ncbi:acyl-CoA thioesterase [Varunaivibrio sulfuroxidans]|uniref:Acyl-CoA thioester hydrolase n=1 Tax=Varunaivibrio sulfuroxidans TaxID=1773489 RepID=A0A4V2UNZ9_9PROT|nr:thioesterase family protein [Varunaivibrio sulfuroxidans]TCS63121.1 acyl-CoA thioester hydrolase [Varunaivibrio sulfuroxidans]WES31809.1 thioesterase family protein [Varunaivibrio sulfuroxidans]
MAAKNDRFVRRADFPLITDVQTRWEDNDMLGHVNNVVFYSYFQAAVMHLLDACPLDWSGAPQVAYAAETQCRFFRPLSYPETVEAAIGVTRLGNTSLSYKVALFSKGIEDAAGVGRFVHVIVDRKSATPCSIPAYMREALERFVMKGDAEQSQTIA